MSKEVEDIRWTEYKSDDLEVSETALEIIVIRYQYLVMGISRKLQARLPHYVDADDLMANGQMGLLRAIKKYDLAQGPFSKYASGLIYGSIIDGLRSDDHASRGLRKKQRDLESLEQSLRSEGIEVTEEYLAEELGYTTEKLQELRKNIIASEVSPKDPQESRDLGKGRRDVDPESAAWTLHMQDQLIRLLQKFDRTTQDVVLLKFWGGQSMRSVGSILNISSVEATRKQNEFLKAAREHFTRMV